MTFNPHPLEVLTPYAPPRLTTPQARLALLEASGMALVMLVVFTSEFAAMSPETFVRRILLGTLNMRELLLGYDFTLGKGRAGTPEVLAQLGKAEGFNVDRMDALSVHDEVVSSTRIRKPAGDRGRSGKPAACSAACTACRAKSSTAKTGAGACSDSPRRTSPPRRPCSQARRGR